MIHRVNASTVDRARLRAVLERERVRFHDGHPRSRALFETAKQNLLAGVPMSWMAKWPGGYPIALERARGARLTDVDGHEYVDFCLGDTGAMAGHSPEPVVAAVAERFGTRGGATAMLPTEDAAWVGAALARRFRLPSWQFTLSATDANRFVLRLCRQITRRPRVLVFSYCYHGSVDESLVAIERGQPRSRAGNVGPAVDPLQTTRVVEWNDLAAVEAALAPRDVAAVLTEPALTNIGIVLPEPGFLEGLRAATGRTDTLLVIDETHTWSAGPGGCTAALGLEPDVVTLGKALAGGLPIGAYGVSAAVAERIAADKDADYVDAGGVGGTLAGNALSLAAARATLSQVLTDDAFARMIALAERFRNGVADVIEGHRMPWSVVSLGARVEYRFVSPPPTSGGASAAAGDPELDEYMHLAALNRGVLMTPFHNMALMCPATTGEDVDRHTRVFAEAVGPLRA
jgi:glutamate-1-semialdehyde 2,1-aminomutase